MNKVLENIVHKMVFTCEKATYLIEKKSISFLENIRLKAHLAICKWCNAYNKKVALIDNAMLRISKEKEKEKKEISESEITEFKHHLKVKTLQ